MAYTNELRDYAKTQIQADPTKRMDARTSLSLPWLQAVQVNGEDTSSSQHRKSKFYNLEQEHQQLELNKSLSNLEIIGSKDLSLVV